MKSKKNQFINGFLSIILEDIKKLSSSLIGTFGVSDRIMFEGIFGEFSPTGKLPFEIPSSMESVLNQKEDLPDDSLNPTYVIGSRVFGLKKIKILKA